MFHLASIIVAIAIAVPAISAPVSSRGSSMYRRRLDWSKDLEYAEKAFGATEKFFNAGSAAENMIAPIVEKFTNKPKNDTQQARRSLENLEVRDQEMPDVVYEVREPQNIEFVEARSGNFSLKNMLQHASHAIKNAAAVLPILKDAATVGGIAEDVGEAALFLREYEQDLHELD